MSKYGEPKLKWGQGAKWGSNAAAYATVPHASDPRDAPGAYYRFGAWDGQEGHPLRLVDPPYQVYYNDGYAQGTWVRSRIEPIGM